MRWAPLSGRLYAPGAWDGSPSTAGRPAMEKALVFAPAPGTAAPPHQHAAPKHPPGGLVSLVPVESKSLGPSTARQSPRTVKSPNSKSIKSPKS
eukprot:gene11253-19767_t